jgi:formylglycine-generating enzyme required for sulfatase activity
MAGMVAAFVVVFVIVSAAQWAAQQAAQQAEQRAEATRVAVAAATRVALVVEAINAGLIVEVPAGEFLMGSTDADSNAASDEKPQRKVYLDAFLIDRTEVTNAMYARCVQASACRPPNDVKSSKRSSYYGNAQYANYPVVYVSWNDAQAYCKWAGSRLPTEAEWEKAARGPSTGSGGGRIYPWGNEPPDAQRSNFAGKAGDTTPVGAYPVGASPYGALDMAGNVWEWVADWYDEKYYASMPARNPQGPGSGQNRVRRGGSWYYPQSYVRAANRTSNGPGLVDDGVGFRCARSP